MSCNVNDVIINTPSLQRGIFLIAFKVGKSMEIHILFVFLFIIKSSAQVQRLSPLCEGNSADCNSLILEKAVSENVPLNGCYMHNHAACMEFPFQKWTNKSLIKLTTEVDAGFDVTAFVYNFKGPAYNLTITRFSSDINGFVMKLAEIGGNYKSCRIFDFRKMMNAQDSFKQPFSIYYDCYDRLEYNMTFQYSLTVQSLPNNKQLLYKMNVPSISYSEIGCNTETFVMMLMEALHHNKVSLKFQKLPEKFNISKYELRLTRTDPLGFSQTRILNVNSANDKKMVSSVFENIDRGVYNLSIKPLREEGRKCRITYFPFFIDRKLPNYAYIGWIVGIVIAALLISASSYYALMKKKKSILEKCRRKILIAYHPDNNEFVDLVCCLATYLEKIIPATIFMQYYLVNENSTEWAASSLADSDIIIIILSSGIVNGKIDMPAPPPYGSLFWCICNNMFNVIKREQDRNYKEQSKIYIKVYFENYNLSTMPDVLKYCVPSLEYKLMRDFKKVFCRIKGASSFWSFLLQLPNTEIIDVALNKVMKKI